MIILATFGSISSSIKFPLTSSSSLYSGFTSSYIESYSLFAFYFLLGYPNMSFSPNYRIQR
ncbi:hypothetical protein N431DRAFT_34899 [Stipitochalara longipes BDJ]|nr:hypothetical protein N431DRAFT_34899 [Stipitochalara longipes BDJ]